MFHRFPLAAIAAGSAVSLLAASAVVAAPIEVGTGPASVEVLLNFPDGYAADYLVHYGDSASSTISTYDATVAADTADSGLSLTWLDFGFGPFLNLASYSGGHVGDGDTFDSVNAPENWWHEWLDAGTGWTFGSGATSDILGDGDRVGWVFGVATAPVPEPAVAGLAAVFGGCALLKRRRSASASEERRAS
jgi:hypothetical protein